MATGRYLESWVGSAGGTMEAPTATNLATAFTPTRPMCAPGTDNDQLVVLMDVSVSDALNAAIKDGMKKIGLD